MQQDCSKNLVTRSNSCLESVQQHSKAFARVCRPDDRRRDLDRFTKTVVCAFQFASSSNFNFCQLYWLLFVRSREVTLSGARQGKSPDCDRRSPVKPRRSRLQESRGKSSTPKSCQNRFSIWKPKQVRLILAAANWANLEFKFCIGP